MNKTFKDYVIEAGANITPPSGNTISPSSSTKPQEPKQPASPQSSNIKALWPGQGAPVEVGMTVGVKDTTGKSIPGTISQVDQAANGVKVKNTATGQDEWINLDNLEPFVAAQEQDDLQRLKELAGINETCSAGATGAGAIAVAPTAMGKMHKRQPAKEELKKEYTPKTPPKTIVGDTKPHQASGELSATLAANGKKTASRKNNGFKR